MYFLTLAFRGIDADFFKSLATPGFGFLKNLEDAKFRI